MSSLPVADEPRRGRTRALAGLAALAVGLSAREASAGALDRELPPVPTYHLLGGMTLGKGLRFDNPYRLPTELGADAESFSLTATYVDVRIGATLGGAGRWSHGIALDTSIATDGIPQEVITPAYLVLFRPVPRFGAFGRAGVPVVVEPDLNAGFEAALGGVFYATAALGITASLVGSLFYGAATLDSPRSTIPILSVEAGVLYDFEVLP